MTEPFGRRKLITTGLAAAAGASGLAAAIRLADRYGLIPPDYGGIYGIGETPTYAVQRLLDVPTFARSRIQPQRYFKSVSIDGEPPENEIYQRLSARGFAGWRLTVDSLVARPSSFSLAQLKQLPSRTQITHHACEEGWSFIAGWTGVPLSYILNMVGVRPQARYVVFFPFDESWDSLDMADVWHPQTLLAYGMNGAELPTAHGAPVRLRVARQLGYKSVKYLSHVTVTHTLTGIGEVLGSFAPEVGYSWYAGI